MIALTTPYLWFATRATGIVVMLLFTAVVALGTLVANRVGGTFIGRFEVNEVHRSLSMVAMFFLAIHIVTTVLDSFVSTGLISAFIPMTSTYKRVPVALGAVAFDLLLAVWISSLLKLRIKNQSWRFIHWFSWLAFATSLVHGYLTGTDAHKGIGMLLVAGCAGFVALAGIWRFLGRPTRAAGRTALSPLASPPVPPRPRLPESFPKTPPRPPASRGRR
ncbi:MAG: ferric reductase [Acidimicrobiaceae bacterium]|nr:ferric reductase [Acidimicrobiaceae bacterium]